MERVLDRRVRSGDHPGASAGTHRPCRGHASRASSPARLPMAFETLRTEWGTDQAKDRSREHPLGAGRVNPLTERLSAVRLADDCRRPTLTAADRFSRWMD
jgi:hypothetical protein